VSPIDPNLPRAADSTELLARLVDVTPTALAFLDRDYKFMWANRAAAEQVSVPEEEIVGRSIFELVPVFWPDLKVLLDRALAGESIREVSVDLNELFDEPRDWIGSFFPFEKGGEIIAVACISFDVTHLRVVESALRDRNDLFAMLARVNAAVNVSSSKQELFDEICELAYTTGNFRYAWVGVPADGQIVGVASAGTEDGYMRSLDWSGLQVTTDPDDPRSWGPTGQAFQTGEISVVNSVQDSAASEVARDAANRFGFHGGAAFPIREGGEVVAILTLYADRAHFFTEEFVETLAEITPSLSLAMDRLALEERRKASDATLMLRDRALSAATQGVVISDARAEDNPIIYVTPALLELTGYAAEELLGTNCRILQGEESDPAAVAIMHKAIAEESSCEVELLNYRKDGSAFWNRVSIAPIRDGAGTLTHYVGVQTDVTERRMLENQFRQAQKMEAVGLLAGGVAHDFNNLLTAIRGSADLALAEVKTESVRADLMHINEAAEHAAHLTGQLLAFSRQQVLKPQSTDLNRVVAETTGMIARVIGENILLREELGGAIETVLVDRAQLQQVMLNLAINARDAMPTGGKLTIETSSADLDESYVSSGRVPKAGKYAIVRINDNGEGMDEATQAKVFEPFFTTKESGTGLGLATVYGIVSQSGGHISVDSELGLGTTFCIYLPTTSEEVSPIRGDPTVSSGSLEGKETILHVEDSDMLRPLVARALTRYGYTVISAGDSEEALDTARDMAGKIDLVITDIVMPGLNGRELAEILTAQYPDVKVLFTSGYPADMMIRQGIAQAEVNFIEKPFRAAELVPLVRSILDGATAPAGVTIQ
jgi:PAS domain S-box-containing protein